MAAFFAGLASAVSFSALGLAFSDGFSAVFTLSAFSALAVSGLAFSFFGFSTLASAFLAGSALSFTLSLLFLADLRSAMAFSAFSNCANLLRSAAASRSAFSARA